MLDKSQDLLWRPEYRNILNFKVHEGEKINVTVYHDDCVKFWVWSLKISLKTYDDMQCGVH